MKDAKLVNGVWIYPQVYYKKHKIIAKSKLLSNIASNSLLQEAIKIDPRIGTLLDEAKKEKCVLGYNSSRTFYDYYKPRVIRLAGWESELLRTQAYYDVVYQTVYELLPADEVDLYPDGIMPNGMFCPTLQERYDREYPE